MKKSIALTLALGLTTLGAAGVAVFLLAGRPPEPVPPSPAAAGSAPAAPAASSTAAPEAGFLPHPREAGATPWDKMEDGSPVPPLPKDAPARVKLGVLLITHREAQGAKPSERSKADAHKLAEQIQAEALSNFEHAVEKADRGSAKDIGYISQGILEKRLEAAVFRLERGKLAPGPLDTPRGFWVVKRLD